MRHWLAHRLGWNEGTVCSGTDAEGCLFVWFECYGCGKVSGLHWVSGIHLTPGWLR